MTINQVSTFLATGAIVIGLGILAIWANRLLAFYFEPSKRLHASVKASFRGYGLWLAWLMALVATFGSLYYSQIAHFPPCEYCWYQRIAMYPLAVIIGIAAFRRDMAIRRYVLPLAVIGGSISSYHYMIQQFPNLSSGTCATAIPCTAALVWKYDFVSIPFMALVSFAAIITVLALDRPEPDSSKITPR